MNTVPEQIRLRLPGGFHLPPFGIHQWLAAVIVCIALWTVSLGWLALQAADQWIGGWQDELRVHVYLDASRKDQRAALAAELREIDGVTEVSQIEPGQAAQQMQQWLGDVGLDEGELARRLPWTLELLLQPGDDEEFLYADIRDAAHRHHAEVNESELALAQAHRWLARARLAVGFGTALLGLAMMLIISNTLRMTLLARAEEIHLMRLLGAREWFVRMPFVLEGLALGGGAGLAAWILIWPMVGLAGDWLRELGIAVYPWRVLLPLVLGGTLVGGLGAGIATMRVVSSEQRIDASA